MPTGTSMTLRALARLLSYPDAGLRAALAEIAQAVRDEDALAEGRQDEIEALACRLAAGDPYAIEAAYVETFDRGRATSLHLFEHVHGDSRERGPAMIDLVQTYEKAGLYLAPQELPDYLPAILEFASTQPVAEARSFLAEMAHILQAIFTALQQRRSPYASVLGALIELAGEKAQAVNLAPEEPLDTSWEEPAAFDGCGPGGQIRPGQAQPMHFIRRSPPSEGART